MKVIGLSGKAGVGKDYLSRTYIVPLFCRNQAYMILSFSDFFKLETIVKDGVNRERVYGEKDHESRKMLQKRGTEEGRDVYGQDVWVNFAYEFLLEHSKRGIVWFFITDVRFKNEVDFIVEKCKGVVIRVTAPLRNLERIQRENHVQEAHDSKKKSEPVEDLSKHISENDLENMVWTEGPLRSCTFEIFNDPKDEDTVVNQVITIYNQVYDRFKKDQICFWILTDPESHIPNNIKIQDTIVVAIGEVQKILQFSSKLASKYRIEYLNCIEELELLKSKYPAHNYIQI